MEKHYQVTNKTLGLDVGLGFDNEPTSRDIFELLKKEQLIAPREIMRLAEGNNEQDKQFAISAYKNGFFDEPDVNVDYLEIGSQVMGMVGEGIENFTTVDPISEQRLGSLAKGIGAIKPNTYYPYSHLMGGTANFSNEPEEVRYQGEIDDDLDARLNKSASRLMEASRMDGLGMSMDNEDGRNILMNAMGAEGLPINDEDLQKEVALRSMDLSKLQEKATLYQSVTNITGGYRLLGSLANRELKQAHITGSKKKKDETIILEELKHMGVTHDVMATMELGPTKGAEILDAVGKKVLEYGTATTPIPYMFDLSSISFRDRVTERQIRNAINEGLIKPDEAQALLFEVAGDPANYLTAGASISLQRGLRSVAQGQVTKLGETLQKASASRTMAKSELNALQKPNVKNNLTQASYEAIEKPLQETLQGAEKIIREVEPKYLKLTSTRGQAPILQAGLGHSAEQVGRVTNKLGQMVEWITKVPQELAVDALINSSKEINEEIAKKIIKGLKAGAVGFGLYAFGDLEDGPVQELLLGASIYLGPEVLKIAGTTTRHLGRHMRDGVTSRNFFEYYQQLDTRPLLSGALVDRTTDPASFARTFQAGKEIFKKEGVDVLTRGIARGMTATKTDSVASFIGRSGLTATTATALPGAIGYATGGEAGMVSSISASLPFLAFGMSTGELMRFGSQSQIRAKQRGDVSHYRGNLDDQDGLMYDKMKFYDQVAIAQAQTKYPNAQIIFGDDTNMAGSDGYHTLGDDGVSRIHINVDSKEPMVAILGHELGHHIMRHGLGPMVKRIYFGDVATGETGIFTKLDGDGNPTVAYENGTPVYELNAEFNKARDAYLDRLKSSGADEMMIRKYQNPAEILEEVLSEHVAHRMLMKVKGELLGDFGVMNDSMTQLTKSLYSALTGNGFRRDVVTSMGGYLNEDGRFGNDIFQIEENKAVTKLIDDFEKESSRKSKQEMDDTIEDDGIYDTSISLSDVRDNKQVMDLFSNRFEKDANGNPVLGLDGLPRLMSEGKTDKLGAELAGEIFDKIEQRGDTLPDGHVRINPNSDEPTKMTGLFLDDTIIDSLANNPKYSTSQINFLRQASAIGRAIQNGDFSGNEVLMFYYPATRGGRKYRTLKGGYRTALVYGITLTKDKNINLETLSITGIDKNLTKLLKGKKRTNNYYSAFGVNNDQALKSVVYDNIKLMLKNQQMGIENGTPGSGISPKQKDMLNVLMKTGTKAQDQANPMLANVPKLESVIRSRRLERIGSIKTTGRGSPVNYFKIRENLLPKRKDTPGQMSMDDLLEQNPQMSRDERVKVGNLDYIPRTPDYDPSQDIPALANRFLEAYDIDSDNLGMIDSLGDAWAEKHNIDPSKLIFEARKQWDRKNGYQRQLPASDKYRNMSDNDLTKELAKAEKEFQEYGDLMEDLAPIYPEPGGYSAKFPEARNQKAEKLQEVRDAIKDRDATRPVVFERLLPRSEGFKSFVKDSDFVDVDSTFEHEFLPNTPVVIEGFHGSTHSFNVIDPSKANPDNHFGQGFYITNEASDVGTNYANLEGSDLRGKISLEAERMQDEILFSDDDNPQIDSHTLVPEATEIIARNMLTGSGPQTYKVYAKFNNPLVLRRHYDHQGTEETFFDYAIDEDGEESGSLVDFFKAGLDNAFNDSKFVENITLNQLDSLKSNIRENALGNGGIGALELTNLMRESYDLEDVAVRDAMTGRDTNGGMEFVRSAFEHMGFDGIIDQSVPGKFPLMKGMNDEVVHFIAFKPEQVKSATGNRGTFDPANPDMRMLPKDLVDTNTPEFSNWFGDSKIVDENGDPRVVEHGTRSGPFNIFGTRSEELSAIGMHYFTSKPAIAEHFGPKEMPSGENMVTRQKQTIKIPTTRNVRKKVDGVSKYKRVQEDTDVSAFKTKIPGLLFHRAVGYETDKNPLYAITHILSGKAFGKFRTKAEANRALQGFQKTGIDFTGDEKSLMSLSKAQQNKIVDAVKKARDAEPDPVAQMFGYAPDRTGYGRVDPFYLKMEKPIDLSSIQAGRNISSVTLRKKLNEFGIDINPAEFGLGERKLYQFLNSADFADELRAMARSKGYDGIIYNDLVEGKKGAKGESYIVFQSNQIKSADRNVGSFNPADPDVRYLPKKAKVHPEALPVVQKVDSKGKPKQKYDKKTKKYEPDYEGIDYDLMGSPMSQRNNKKTNNKKLDFSKINVRLNGAEKQRLQEIYNTDLLDEAVQEMSNDYIEWMKDPEVRAGQGWYSRMRTKLKNALGKKTEFFAQLLGATSANTPVEQNFIQAVEAMQLFDQGEYNTMVQLYLDGYNALKKGKEELYNLAIKRGVVSKDFVTLADGKTFSNKKTLPGDVFRKWIEHYDLVPKRKAIDKKTGKRKNFNINSNAVMKVFAGSWLDLTQAPKTPNFAGNLTGRTLEATIDVWAGRYLRRMMYRGQKQWRIQPASEQGVSNIDFALGQMIFRATADKLKINPDDLQAIAWFGEKGVWDTNRWTGEQGAYKSSFDDPFNVFFPQGSSTRSYQEGGDIIKLKQAQRRVMKGEDMVAKPGQFGKNKDEAKQYLETAEKDVEKAKLKPGVAQYFLTGK